MKKYKLTVWLYDTERPAHYKEIDVRYFDKLDQLLRWCVDSIKGISDFRVYKHFEYGVYH